MVYMEVFKVTGAPPVILRLSAAEACLSPAARFPAAAEDHHLGYLRYLGRCWLRHSCVACPSVAQGELRQRRFEGEVTLWFLGKFEEDKDGNLLPQTVRSH